MDPFVGEVRVFGFDFAPRGWATCDGQLLPISQNTALFSLLGTNYGGDGRSTFGLPDLRGRAPMMWGQGPGLTMRMIGEAGGSPTATLTEAQIPAHTHTLAAASADGNSGDPDGRYLAVTSGGTPFSGSTPNGSLATQAMTVAGGNQPHDNMQPHLLVTYCIALQGIFPPRQ